MTNEMSDMTPYEKKLAQFMVDIHNEIRTRSGNPAMAAGITCAMGIRCVAMIMCAYKDLPLSYMPQIVTVMSEQGVEAALEATSKLCQQRLEAN
jgi:dihydropteroate synthase